MRPREQMPQEELFPFVEMEKLIPEYLNDTKNA